jgi:hypothetical protein
MLNCCKEYNLFQNHSIFFPSFSPHFSPSHCPYAILYIKVTMSVCLSVYSSRSWNPYPKKNPYLFVSGLKKWGAYPFRDMGQGQGRAGAGAVYLSVWQTRVGAGQGKALFSVTLAFTNRPSDDRVQIITVFTNCHWKQWFKPSAPPQFHRVSVIEFQLPCRALQAQVTTSFNYWN